MKGFTVIELLVVIAIVGTVAGVSTPFLSSYIERSNRHTDVDRVRSAIIKAQNYAMDGKTINNSVTWGVCIIANTFRMYNGSCENPNFREDYKLRGVLPLFGIFSITFGNLRGEPSTPSAVTIPHYLGTSTIVINDAGMVQVN